MYILYYTMYLPIQHFYWCVVNSLRIKSKENIVTSMSHWYYRIYFFSPSSIRVQRQTTEKSQWSAKGIEVFWTIFFNDIQ